MNVAAVFFADFVFYLPDSLDKRQGLDVADSTADFRNDDVGIRFFGGKEHTAQNLFRYIRNDLNGAAVKAALALLVEHGKVNAPRRRVGRLGKRCVRKAFVVPEVKVGLRTVVRNENFSMLIRIHRARIDVQVGVEFLIYDFKPEIF